MISGHPAVLFQPVPVKQDESDGKHCTGEQDRVETLMDEKQPRSLLRFRDGRVPRFHFPKEENIQNIQAFYFWKFKEQYITPFYVYNIPNS